VGLNLGLRLYLILVALILPVFGLGYVFAVRAVEALHEEEVAATLRLAASRIEDWAARASSVEEPGPEEREILSGALRRLTEEPNGIESVTVFGSTATQMLQAIASFGPNAALRPAGEDLDAASKGTRHVLNIVRAEREFQAVSWPLSREGALVGVIHMEVLPGKIGLGSRIHRLKVVLLAGAGALMGALALALVFFFHYDVRRPIRQLNDAMEHAAGGNLSALVDVRTGEIGWLSSSYNQMMRRLKQSMDENRSLIVQIRGFNEDLTKKIEAATGEVAAKNVQLEAANERLFLLQRRLTTVEKLATLGEIAAIIAHELGTPLNAISGHLQLLLQDPVADPGMASRLKVIDGQVDRLTNIVRGVLKSMRVPPPRLSSIDLKRVIGDVVDLFVPVAEKRAISIHLKLEESLPHVQGDPEQLQQVFMNLFTNAMDAMKERGVLSVAARHVAEDRDTGLPPGVRIDVSDTGVGMDEETARQIFEPFFTTRRPDSEAPLSVGLGLGLSICRQILKNHDGEIAVKSERGKGTVFTIFLPIAPRLRGA
jgi:signal transduction histidine kinase